MNRQGGNAYFSSQLILYYSSNANIDFSVRIKLKVKSYDREIQRYLIEMPTILAKHLDFNAFSSRNGDACIHKIDTRKTSDLE